MIVFSVVCQPTRWCVLHLPPHLSPCFHMFRQLCSPQLSPCSRMLCLGLCCSLCFQHPPCSPKPRSTLIHQENSSSCFRTHHGHYLLGKSQVPMRWYIPSPSVSSVLLHGLWKAVSFLGERKLTCSSSHLFCPAQGLAQSRPPNVLWDPWMQEHLLLQTDWFVWRNPTLSGHCLICFLI